MMIDYETWTFILIPVIVFVVIGIIVAIIFRQYMGKKDLLQHQAIKRNGVVKGSFLMPFLQFKHRDLLVQISYRPGSRYQPPETTIRVGITSAQPRNFSVYRETVAGRISKKFGSQDIQLGIDEFDSKFMIKSDDEFYMRSLLDLAVQNKLLDIYNFHPHVRLEGNNLTIDIPRILSSDEDYDKFIDVMLTIVDRISDLH